MNFFISTTSQVLTSNQQSIKSLELQMGQLTQFVHERERRTLPSQPEANPRMYQQQHMKNENVVPRGRQVNHVEELVHHVNAIVTLRNGKQVDNHISLPPPPPPSDDISFSIIIHDFPM